MSTVYIWKARTRQGSVKRGELWYGSVACAEGRSCPFDVREPAVSESALYSRPRRFFAARAPKELRAAQDRPAGRNR